MIARIDCVDGYYLKRCDLLEYAGAYGGKSEGAFNIIQDGIQNGYTGFVTVGSRFSPQCDIVSKICSNLDVECVLFMPSGDDTNVTSNIKRRANCKIIDTLKQGSYTNVLISRAMNYSKAHNKCFIPFGMLCKKNIDIVAKQVYNIPEYVHRIVVPVGSGCTMIGIIQGLNEVHRTDVEVVGVITGSSNSKKVINNLVPKLFNKVPYKIVEYISGIKPKYVYTTRTNECVGTIKLDPIYEGKCKKFLKPGDLLWIVGYHDI